MVWWIVGGLIVLGLVLSMLVVSAVMGRLRPLNRALRRLRMRVEQAEQIQAGVNNLQARAGDLQSQLELTKERADQMRAGAQTRRQV